jgi:hypothetical protein
MIGVTLRYKWISRALFMGSGLEPVPHQGGYLKKCIQSPGSGILVGDKNTHSVVYYDKKNNAAVT